MKSFVVLVFFTVALSCLAYTGSAQEEPGRHADAPDTAQLEASLQFSKGDVPIGDGLATLRLGDRFKFLGPADTQKVLTAWGNPPGSAALGMLMPAELSPFEQTGWAVLVTYREDGHVSDEDAKDLDYAEVLQQMQADTEASNTERQQAGYPPVHLVGWAEPPHYDAATHKLYWARTLDFGGPVQTLNYDIRVLGRKGVLELSAIATMSDLARIKADMPKVLETVDFNQGMRYADFSPGADKVAAYGIGALVAGKLAAKAGMFKVIVAALLASKKLIAMLGVGAVMLGRRLLGRKEPKQSSGA